MKAFILFVLLIFSSNTFSQNVSHLFELKGLEDSLGQTHLFYRYGGANTICWKKSIYHFDLITNIDTLFIPDFGMIVDPGSWWCQGNYIFDYEFFDKDPSKYIYGGYQHSMDPTPILIRYDDEIQILAIGGITEIEISEQNDSLVYAALDFGGLYKSIDGGYNFTINEDSLAWINKAMISLSKNDDTQIYGIDDSKLVRSEDEGQSYIIVDDDIHWAWNYEKELYYDADGQHIYGVAASSNESVLLVSDVNGDPFTWNLIFTTPGKIWFTLDEQIQGEIYYSYNKSIYKSTDFGNSFSLYKQLEQKITGLYKKSNTDILYTSTMFNIYEITPDSIIVIKSLPIPDEILNYYPLAIGNFWVYTQEVHDVGSWEVVNSYLLREVISDSMMTNNQIYKKVKEFDAYIGNEFIFYERVDSTTGLVYRYSEDSVQTNYEYLLDDLLSEIGDTILTFRLAHYGLGPSPEVIHSENNIFNDFGLTRSRKVYSELYSSGITRYSLTEEIGLDSLVIDLLDVYTSYVDLKGCIINGVVYGDTIVVSVEDDIPNLPTKFSLSQNYPNPFNPSTKIKFTIPTSPQSPPYQGGEAKQGWLVQLKVYDVLGNEIATLVNEELTAGSYEVEFSAKGGSASGGDAWNLPSGVYFYQLKAGSFIQTKKMLLIK